MLLEDVTLLYAEDDSGIQQTVAKILEEYVANVIVAQDGYEVIELNELYKPSILLLDIRMPRKDGLSALEEIRKKDIKTPAIIMTAHTDKEYLLNAVELYITKYLVKPFGKKSLLNALDTCMETLNKRNDELIPLSKELIFNYKKQFILKNNEEIFLNKKERQLLNLLLKNKDRVLSYDELEYHIWDGDVSFNALKSLIKDLRKKTSKNMIRNISKIGYKLEIEKF